MGIIKQVDAVRVLNDAVAFDLGDLGKQARRLLEAAHREADRIVEEAHAAATERIEAERQSARREGHAQGLAEGRERGEEVAREAILAELGPQLTELSSAWKQMLERWEADRDHFLESSREDVLRFAMALAKKVVFRILETDPAVVNEQLADALALLSRPSAVEVAINPADRPLVELVLPEILQRIKQCRHVSLRDDPAVGRGGCRLVTEAGEIDATIERQLESIAEALRPRQIGTDLEAATS